MENLLELFGTDDVEKIVSNKSSEKQTRAFSASKPKRVELSVAECKRLCKSVGLEYLDGYEGRVVEHVITDETKDRYGDIVRAKGADVNNFKKNPVILFGHNYTDFPIGKSIKVWVDKDNKNVKSWGLYFDKRVDETGRSSVAFKFITAGGLPAVSVGFMPTKINRPKSKEEREKIGLGEYGVEFTGWELLEYSAVPVPANPNALQNMVKSGELNRRECEMIINDKLIETDNYEVFVNEVLNAFTTEEVDEENTTVYSVPDFSEQFEKATEVLEKFNETLTELNKTLQPLTDLKVDSPPVKPASDDNTKDASTVFNEVFGEGN